MASVNATNIAPTAIGTRTGMRRLSFKVRPRPYYPAARQPTSGKLKCPPKNRWTLESLAPKQAAYQTALKRRHQVLQEIRGSRGICSSADLSWECFSTGAKRSGEICGSRTKSAKMRDSCKDRGSGALYQGPTLVGPQRPERELGFSPCGTTESAVIGH
jgi:hypothetical protein